MPLKGVDGSQYGAVHDCRASEMLFSESQPFAGLNRRGIGREFKTIVLIEFFSGISPIAIALKMLGVGSLILEIYH